MFQQGNTALSESGGQPGGQFEQSSASVASLHLHAITELNQGLHTLKELQETLETAKARQAVADAVGSLRDSLKAIDGLLLD